MCKMFVKLLLETDLYPESRYAENPILDKLEGDTGDFNILSASFWYRLGSKATEISLFAFVRKCFLVI